MGQPVFNPILDGFSRSIGNLTFYKHGGKTFTRRRSAPTGAPTSKQSAVRRSFLQAAADWRTLPAIIRKSWNEAAQYGRGYNRYIGVNSPKYREKSPVKLSEAFGLEIQPAITAAAGGSGQIVLSASEIDGFSGELTVFYRPVPAEGEAYTRFSSVHQPVTGPASVTILGCVPGKEYELQAILSDKELTLASALSASIGLKASAGA